jgi:hypothetical protein
VLPACYDSICPVSNGFPSAFQLPDAAVFSVSAAAALLPPTAGFAPCSASSFLHDLPFLFVGVIYRWFPCPCCFQLETLIIPKQAVRF